MLKQFKKNYTSKDKIINLLIILYAAVLPWGHATANIVLGVIAAFFLFRFFLHKKIVPNNFKYTFWVINFSFLFFIYLLSILYTDNLELGLHNIIKKIPILSFAVIILYFKKEIEKGAIIKSLKLFSFSVVLICVISIILSTYFCYDYKPEILLYCISDQNLAEVFISYHKLYLALYICISIFFLLYTSFFNKKKYTFLSWENLQILILFFSLILLGARNSIGVSVIFIISFPIIYWIKNKAYLKLLICSFVISFTVISSISLNPILREKIKEGINYQNQYNINKKWGGFTIRKLIWEYTLYVVNENPLLGVGVGDTQVELNKSYLNCTESNALKYNVYNTHNDLLQITVTTGIVGLCLYLFSFTYIFQVSFKNKNYIHCAFMLLFLFSGLTESILERDMGIRVYAFFTVLLFVYKKNIHENSSNT